MDQVAASGSFRSQLLPLRRQVSPRLRFGGPNTGGATLSSTPNFLHALLERVNASRASGDVPAMDAEPCLPYDSHPDANDAAPAMLTARSKRET